jgi:hypothetical protein
MPYPFSSQGASGSGIAAPTIYMKGVRGLGLDYVFKVLLPFGPTAESEVKSELWVYDSAKSAVHDQLQDDYWLRVIPDFVNFLKFKEVERLGGRLPPPVEDVDNLQFVTDVIAQIKREFASSVTVPLVFPTAQSIVDASLDKLIARSIECDKWSVESLLAASKVVGVAASKDAAVVTASLHAHTHTLHIRIHHTINARILTSIEAPSTNIYPGCV